MVNEANGEFGGVTSMTRRGPTRETEFSDPGGCMVAKLKELTEGFSLLVEHAKVGVRRFYDPSSA